jgi:hypothetical protein
VTDFARTIGIDFSGEETPTACLKGLRVYQACRPVERARRNCSNALCDILLDPRSAYSALFEHVTADSTAAMYVFRFAPP